MFLQVMLHFVHYPVWMDLSDPLTQQPVTTCKHTHMLVFIKGWIVRQLISNFVFLEDIRLKICIMIYAFGEVPYN